MKTTMTYSDQYNDNDNDSDSDNNGENDYYSERTFSFK